MSLAGRPPGNTVMIGIKTVRRARAVASGLVARASDQRRDSRVHRTARAFLGNRLPVYWFADWPNFGDLIAPHILRALFGTRAQLVPRSYAGKILTIGSILHELRPGDVVWGSGSICDQPIDGKNVTFLAVRGPMTRKLIDGDVPETYGDPGMLLPYIYSPRRIRRFDIGLVPHAMDREVIRSNDPSVAIINVRARDWRSTIDQITACNVILSSSLHGIIVAESYGIPAVWIEASRRVLGAGFKFRDYYAATGREVAPEPWSRGLRNLASRAEKPPNMDMRALIDAWPYST